MPKLYHRIAQVENSPETKYIPRPRTFKNFPSKFESPNTEEHQEEWSEKSDHRWETEKGAGENRAPSP